MRAIKEQIVIYTLFYLSFYQQTTKENYDERPADKISGRCVIEPSSGEH